MPPQLPIDQRSDPVTVAVSSLDDSANVVTACDHGAQQQPPTSARGSDRANPAYPASLPLKVTVRKTFIEIDSEEVGTDADDAVMNRRDSRARTVPARVGQQPADDGSDEDGGEDSGQDTEGGSTKKSYAYDSTPFTHRHSDHHAAGGESFMPPSPRAPERPPPPAEARAEGGGTPRARPAAPQGSRSIVLQIPMQVPGDLESSPSEASDLTATVTDKQISIEGRCAVVDLRVIIGPSGATHTATRPFPPSANQPLMVNSSMSCSSPPGIGFGTAPSAGSQSQYVEVGAAQEATSARSRKKAVKQRAAAARPEDDTKKSSIVCCHWKNKGFCKLDASCKFMHPVDKKGVGVGSNKGQVHPGGMGWPMSSNGMQGMQMSPGFPFHPNPMGFPPVMAHPAAAAMVAAHVQLSIAAALSPQGGHCEQ